MTQDDTPSGAWPTAGRYPSPDAPKPDAEPHPERAPLHKARRGMRSEPRPFPHPSDASHPARGGAVGRFASGSAPVATSDYSDSELSDLDYDDSDYDDSDLAFSSDGALDDLLDRLVKPTRVAIPQTNDHIGADGRYLLGTRLGRGGQGIVFEAKDMRLNRPVAVKFILGDPLEDEAVWKRRCSIFDEEIYLLGQLQHENIVAVYDRGRWDNVPFLVMEHLTGQTLRTVLRHARLLKPLRALKIITQIAEGLRGAHRASIIHRDLKPENIILQRDDRVRILDFGLAWLKPDPEQLIDAENANAAGRPTRRVEGGTARYMAPEQWARTDQDHRTDLYALGVILHEMLTGEHPFPHESAEELRTNILQAPPEPLPGHLPLPPDARATLQNAIHRLLRPSPDDRYPHVADLLSDLQAVQRELEDGPERPATAPNTPIPAESGVVRHITGTNAPVEPPAPPPPRRWPLVALGLVTVGVALVGVAPHVEFHSQPVVFQQRLGTYLKRIQPTPEPTCLIRTPDTQICALGPHTLGSGRIHSLDMPLRVFVFRRDAAAKAEDAPAAP